MQDFPFQWGGIESYKKKKIGYLGPDAHELLSKPKDQFLLVKVDFLTAQCQHLAVHQYVIFKTLSKL